MIKLYFLSIAVGFLLLTICQSFASFYEDRELFRDEEAGFEVAYAKSWEVNPLTKGKRLAIRNSDTSKLGVISVSVANAKNEAADPERYMAFCREKLPTILLKSMHDRFGNGEIIEHDDVKLSGHPAHRLTMTYNIEQPTGSISLVSAQIHCVKDGKLYILSFESPAKTFDENWTAFEKIMTTFNFR